MWGIAACGLSGKARTAICSRRTDYTLFGLTGTTGDKVGLLRRPLIERLLSIYEVRQPKA
jgi:hypothetical protein